MWYQYFGLLSRSERMQKNLTRLMTWKRNSIKEAEEEHGTIVQD
jgi:hypothetical protein